MQGNSLIELIYKSTVSTGFDRPMVDALLETARNNNQARNITGMLCFDGEHFVQILEGHIGDVERIFGCICEDSRHDNVQQIYTGDIAERNFHNWSMGYQFMSPLTGEVIEKAWNGLEDRLRTSGKTETRGITFLRHLKNSQLKQSLVDWH